MSFLRAWWPRKTNTRSNGPLLTLARNSPVGSSMSRHITRTAFWMKRQIWLRPLIAIVILSVVGYSMRTAIQSTMQASMESELQTLLNVEVAMLENWTKTQVSNAQTLANDAQVRAHVYTLLSLTGDDAAPPDTDPKVAGVTKESVVRELRRKLGPVMTSHDYHGFFITNRGKQILTASQDALIGREKIKQFDDFLDRALDGETVVSEPFLSTISLQDGDLEDRRGTPTMYVCAPIRDESFQVVGTLAFRIRPEREFTRIMQLGRIGNSGETYAFNRAGVMVSNSRFDQDLILVGILPDEPDSQSILRLMLRDPGQNVLELGRPKIRQAELPLTKGVTAAINGTDGMDVNGYRDYRGVMVIGAWKWLPNIRLGVMTEIDYDEAFRPLSIVQTTFLIVHGLLSLAAIAILVYSMVVARLRVQAQKAAIEAKALGQYKLEEKLGAGAMGVVYKGYHAMLRRPTAIKLLHGDKVNDASIQRFEHEVQITCQLNHPNTIAIYDYGRTPEGVFYYAMEYLDGVNLQALVEKYGPLPEGRVIHLLLQICGSLYEAHTKGLVHRDIKPSNIMVNRRGAESDVIKVLDFGLVKAIDQDKQAAMTSPDALTGTPLYMSPEAIQSPVLVDACSDLYAVGAVGYFLLTGQPVFESSSMVELLQAHISQPPKLPSERLGRPVSEALENAVMACLDKNRANRPQTARILAQMLMKSLSYGRWTWDDADAWWGRHERGVITARASGTMVSQTPSSMDRTMISDAPDDD